MANQEHLNLLKIGIYAWNDWRVRFPRVRPDLSNTYLFKSNLNTANLSNANLSGTNLSFASLIEANLSGANLNLGDLVETDLSRANLSRANLSGANLGGASLYNANLIEASLIEASLYRVTLSSANLSNANLYNANLSKSDLSGANLSGANLSGANLSETILVKTNFTKTILTDCRVYGISAWDVELQETKQNSLVISDKGQPTITVDNLEVAQFIHLLLNNTKIRDVINALTTKAVLILGRFSPERKTVLNAIKEELHKQDFLPILFDFDCPSSQTVRETVGTLAHLSYFIIADLTDQRSIPEELETIVPALAVPVKPLLIETQPWEFSMFKGYNIYPWMLPIYQYADLDSLLANLKEQVIEPAKQKAYELTERKR